MSRRWWNTLGVVGISYCTIAGFVDGKAAMLQALLGWMTGVGIAAATAAALRRL